jgi:hypothetical protein
MDCTVAVRPNNAQNNLFVFNSAKWLWLRRKPQERELEKVDVRLPAFPVVAHIAPQRSKARLWSVTELTYQCRAQKVRGVAQSVSNSKQREWSFRCRRHNTPMTGQRVVRIRCIRIEDGKWDSRPWWVPLCKAIVRHSTVAYASSLCRAARWGGFTWGNKAGWGYGCPIPHTFRLQWADPALLHTRAGKKRK